MMKVVIGLYENSIAELQLMIFQQDAHLRYRLIKNPLNVLIRETEFCGKKDEEIMDKDAAMHLKDIKETVLKSGKEKATELRLKLNDTYHWFRLKIFPVFDENALLDGIAGWMIDVSREKELENKIKEIELGFNFVLQSSELLIGNQDNNLCYTWAYNPNPDFDLNHILGKTDKELFQEEDARKLHSIKRWVLENGKPRREEVNITRIDGGQPAVFDVLVEPVLDDDSKVCGIRSTAIDISWERETEEKLREREERLRIALDAAGFGVFDLYPQTGKLVWDDTMKRLWGLDPGEEVDLSRAMDRIHPDDKARMGQVVSDSFDPDGHGNYNAKFRVVFPDGEIRWHEAKGKVYFEKNHEGKLLAVRMAGVESDITQRKKAEEKVLENEKLAAANRDLESFSYSLSHDLRTPLISIGSFTGIIKDEYGNCFDEEGVDYLLRIQEGVEKMQVLIDDMMTLAGISKQNMNRETVNLSILVNDYLESLRMGDKTRLVEFIIQENVYAFADPRLIYLALENLLSNAWKYTSRKPKTIIEFGTLKKNGQKIYLVKDNGDGFNNQYREEIFEPFKRVHENRLFSGTGIGLSIVKRVINRHGGLIWAEGEPGKGATFYFTL
jgi:signal transduction histidine kinase